MVNDFCNQDFHNPVKWILSIYGNCLPGFGGDRKLKGHKVIYNCRSPRWDEQLLWGSFFMLWGMEIGYPDSEVTGRSKVTMSYTNVVPLNRTNNFCRGNFHVMGSVNWILGILTRKEVTYGQTEYGLYIFRPSGTTFIRVVLKSVWWISSYWQDRRQTNRQTDRQTEWAKT